MNLLRGRSHGCLDRTYPQATTMVSVRPIDYSVGRYVPTLGRDDTLAHCCMSVMSL